MKTVIDAVNEFEGDMGCYNYIFVGTNKNKLNRGVSQLTLSTLDNDSWWELCGRHEFLATVVECETNFGKCNPINVSHYKLAEKVLPTKDLDKELAVMKTVIDAVNEFRGEYFDGECGREDYQNEVVMAKRDFAGYRSGDLGIGSGNTKQNEYWLLICTRKEFLATVVECETNFGECGQSYSDYKFDYHLHPALKRNKPTPIFTQEMADNAVLPSVGMECLILYACDNNYSGVITYMGNGCGCFKETNGTEYSFAINSVTFKPPAPPKTDKEKADDLFKFYLKGENTSTHKSFSQAVIDGDFGNNIRWHQHSTINSRG